jgi:hypothetical protein
VVFGTRRPTRTPTRSNPRWKGRLLRAGLDSQSPEYWQPAAGRTKAPTYAPAPPRSRPALARTRPGARAGPAGYPLARAMARHTTPDIAAHSGPRGAETDLVRPGWTQSLAGHHRPQSARHIGPTRHSNRRTCRLLRATDSDGTCRPPASTHHGSARQDKAVTSDKMFPATTLPWDPAQHPSAKTLARPGHWPGPSKYFTAAAAGSSRLQHHHNPRAEATATRMPLRKKDHPPQIASSPCASYSHEQRRARHWPLAFSTLLTSTLLVRTLPPP